MNRVHFVIDEAATVGHLDCIDDAMNLGRGFGIRLQTYFQSMAQLKQCFPDGQEQNFLSNTTQIFFGVNDNTTAEYVSARIGDSTVIVESGGTSSGTSNNWSHGASQPQYGGGGSYGTSSNWAQQARRLIKPEEVIVLSPRMALTFVPGMPPIQTNLLRYYEEQRLAVEPGLISRSLTACSVLATSLMLLVAMIVFAAFLTFHALSERDQAIIVHQVLPQVEEFILEEWAKRPVWFDSLFTWR